jgi:mono/diheme cytochrome c family protein
MSDDRTGRELTPHDGSQPSAPVPTPEQLSVERFSAGPRTHTVGLTEERAAQVVKQSGNARNLAFLAFLVLALFIPVYWFYDLGVPALGVSGRMEATANEQFVTDVQRGYALYLANCARCHGDNGEGGVGPPLNSQPKLFNAINQNGGSGTGHLSPSYIQKVMEVGGRYVCGDANSVMPAWLQPNGPLNYREVEELVTFITASSEVSFTYDPHGGGHGAATDPDATPHTVTGWRDVNWEPAPGATPVPACWRPYSNPAFADTAAPDASLAPIAEPGTVDAPRPIALDLTASLTITDPDGATLSTIAVKAGETVQFEVANTAGFGHNFYIGPEEVLSTVVGDIPNGNGIPEFTEGTETYTWTVPADQTEDLQFACTVPGHYTTMHGDFVIQP